MLTGRVMVSCAAAGDPSVAMAAARQNHAVDRDIPSVLYGLVLAVELFALSVALPDTLPWIVHDLKPQQCHRQGRGTCPNDGTMMTGTNSSGRGLVSAAVLVIGDEILSGRTKDKNIGYIAEYL